MEGWIAHVFFSSFNIYIYNTLCTHKFRFCMSLYVVVFFLLSWKKKTNRIIVQTDMDKIAIIFGYYLCYQGFSVCLSRQVVS